MEINIISQNNNEINTDILNSQDSNQTVSIYNLNIILYYISILQKSKKMKKFLKLMKFFLFYLAKITQKFHLLIKQLLYLN